MINPIGFLWKQFGGPQISGICQGIWLYFREAYDTTLNYFRDFKIETANTDHLTTVGILQGIARPLIPLPDEEMFWFGSEYGYIDNPKASGPRRIPATQYPSDHGFAQYESTQAAGGKFDYEKLPSGYQYIPNYIFEAFLKGNARSSGVLGSIVALDDMLYEIWRIEHEATPPIYKIGWKGPHPGVGNGLGGDISLDLGVTGDWLYPYETLAECRVLGNTVYYPVPKLVTTMLEGDSTIDPEGFVRILLYSEDDVYGLDAMWEGIGTPSDIVAGPEPSFDVNAITLAELQVMWSPGEHTWTDEAAPTREFQALNIDKIQDMWE